MVRVKYPFHVKANGEYFNPGEAIEVEDAEAAVAQGAEVIVGRKPAQKTTEPDDAETNKPRKSD